MKILLTLLPITTLIFMLFLNLLFFDNTMAGPNQTALLIATIIAGIIAHNDNYNFKKLMGGMITSIKSCTQAITILLIIGGLTSTWILSGVVPAMIYYGLELINPKFFLFSACLICIVVSVSTGSSWTTAATIGIALISIGELLSIPKGIVAGAIISGAYFGDKMSPLSETTNLAPSVSGTDLISHIKYMSYTTIPTIVISLILFFLIGLNSNQVSVTLDETNLFIETIQQHFYIGVELFILPLIILILIYKKIPATKTLTIGVLVGVIITMIYQKELIQQINMYTESNTLETMVKTIFMGTNIETDNEMVNNLLSKNGIFGMLWIVLLVITAMMFGGVMYTGGFLKKITEFLISKSSTDIQLIQSTVGSCLFFNFTTCDQYLAIVIPGRMFKEIYREKKLNATNLSRTIEDSGTVTSVLVPWNSCAAYHAEILAVNPIAYIPYCFFNIISPFMTLLFTYLNIRIKRIK